MVIVKIDIISILYDVAIILGFEPRLTNLLMKSILLQPFIYALKSGNKAKHKF